MTVRIFKFFVLPCLMLLSSLPVIASSLPVIARNEAIQHLEPTSGLLRRLAMTKTGLVFGRNEAIQLTEKAESSSFKWQEYPALPLSANSGEQAGLAAPFAGMHNGVLLVVGEKQYRNEIYVLYNVGQATAKWETLNVRFPYPATHGVSISTNRGIVCIGGKDASRQLSKVMLMSWDAGARDVIFTEMPDLPYTNADMGGALIGSTVYVLGGSVDGKPGTGGVYLDLTNEKAGWQRIPDMPGAARLRPVVAAQNAGDETCLYVFGGYRFDAENDADNVADFDADWDADKFTDKDTKPALMTDAYCFVPSRNQWKRIPDVVVDGQARAVWGASAIPTGTGHILFSGGVHQGTVLPELFAYHTITGTYVKAATVPWQPTVGSVMVKSGNGIVWVSGEIKPDVGAGANEPVLHAGAVHGAQIKTDAGFGWINYAVLFAYLFGMLLIGYYFMKKSSGETDDFFRGGKRIPWWAAGISIFATALSSITFLSIPAKSYATDWRMLVFNLTIILGAPIVIRYYLPFFRKLKVASAYQYLEMRFNRMVRYFASALFCLFMITRIAIVLFLPSLALHAVTGINVYFCILMMGLITIAYCTMGGVEAVIWADVIQGFVLVFGALIALAFMINGTEGGIGGFFTTAAEAGKFRTFDFDFNWAQPVFWVALLGGFANQLITYTSDQSVIQRYMTTKDQKSAARGIWLNGILCIPVSLLFFLIGAGLFTFYKSNPAHLDISIQNQDAIFPHFMVTELPVGLSGLLIAAVFSAAMSTLSANINSVSTAITEDFFQQLRRSLTEKTRMRIARVSGVLVGLTGTGFALGLATWDIKSLWDQFNVYLGLLTSGLGGLFLMGIFTRRINGAAAMTGLLASIVILLVLRSYTQVSFLLFGFIGLATSFTIGWGCSYLFGNKVNNYNHGKN